MGHEEGKGLANGNCGSQNETKPPATRSHGAGAAADAAPPFAAEWSEADWCEGAKDLFGMGPQFLKWLPSVQGQGGKAMQNYPMEGVFPLPLPSGMMTTGCSRLWAWTEGVVRSLNWMHVGAFCLGSGPPNPSQSVLLKEIVKNVSHVQEWKGVDLSSFSPQEMFNQKWVNSYGEEVHVARKLRWENVAESLPGHDVCGALPAAEVCTGGFNQ